MYKIHSFQGPDWDWDSQPVQVRDWPQGGPRDLGSLPVVAAGRGDLRHCPVPDILSRVIPRRGHPAAGRHEPWQSPVYVWLPLRWGFILRFDCELHFREDLCSWQPLLLQGRRTLLQDQGRLGSIREFVRPPLRRVQHISSIFYMTWHDRRVQHVAGKHLQLRDQDLEGTWRRPDHGGQPHSDQGRTSETNDIIDSSLKKISLTDGSLISNTWLKEPSSSQEICLTNEFGKFRPRRCNFRFCAICEKLPEVKSIYMKGFCEMVQNFFDKEYYVDGLRNKRIFFRLWH